MKLSIKTQLLKHEESEKTAQTSLEGNPALHGIHAATASERDNKQRRARRILTFRIYVLSKAINVFKKYHGEVYSIKSYIACNKRSELLGHPVEYYHMTCIGKTWHTS